MVQNMILPQIGLAHKTTLKNAIHGTHCVWETPYRETTVFWSHDPKYYATSNSLGPGNIIKKRNTGNQLCLGNAMQGNQCVPIPWPKILYYLRLAWPRKQNKKTQYREPTVFGKRHTGKPLCSDPTTGDHRNQWEPIAKKQENQLFYIVLRTLDTKVLFSLGQYCKKLKNKKTVVLYTKLSNICQSLDLGSDGPLTGPRKLV